MSAGDTIYAESTAPGRAAVAVVRISGRNTWECLVGLGITQALTPRSAALRRLRDPGLGLDLDQALVLWFPAPASFTGEDVAELQVHGGRTVVAAIAAVLSRMDDVRAAEPGEFTRRAVLNGRLDLTEAEGLIDLIDAETEAQRQQAVRQMGGALGRMYESWRHGLIARLAHLEAYIDFPEEELPIDLVRDCKADLAGISEEMSTHLADRRRGELLRDGYRVAIVGPPNAGKSSLLNCIAGRDVAIVSERAGTTRDVIEVRLSLAGYPVILADTAGIRDALDEIEEEGVARARAWAGEADLRLIVVDIGSPVEANRTIREFGAGHHLVVGNKIDAQMNVEDHPRALEGMILVSATTGAGVLELLDRLKDEAVASMGVGEAPALTRERHRAALSDCVGALTRFHGWSGGEERLELAVEDLRRAADALGRITGKTDVEELLDVIFRDFCIGK
ncbi:MAG: tRNA uridine-5-carboxymethylaminomethyl(34) synthesis GTPase MnmE [Rhodospirillaceae bacterium]|nr:tRNA uridine-5-carboxymethylaminomethyl(34) synthesis GTPase MnmE [Rhodospirillaceae bacterium]